MARFNHKIIIFVKSKILLSLMNSLIRLCLVLVSIQFAVGFSACAGKNDYPTPPRYVPHPSGKMPIVAHYAFYPPFVTNKQFAWVREAGFNTISKRMSSEALDSVIRIAERNDLYILAGVGLSTDTIDGLRKLNRFKNRKGVWGFSLFDEPNTSQFEKLGKLQRIVDRNSPSSASSINLLPAVDEKQLQAPDYRTYVERYVRTVNPPNISFDAYPVQKKGNGEIYVNDIFYRTIEVVSDVAKQSGRPFWSYILSNRHAFYPEPKEEYIRFQAFAALAYGAQGFGYFTYLLPDFDKDGYFSDAPIDRNGNRTKVWYMVRNVNREIHNLSNVFLGADVQSVTHTGISIPKGTKRLRSLPRPFLSISSDGEGLIVSHLRNGDDEYLVVVNRDVLRPQNVYLDRSRSVTRVYGNGTERTESNPRFSLSPGGYAIFKI